MTIAVVVTTLLMCSAATAQRKRRTRPLREQTSFGSETPTERPVKLPKDVISQLSNFDKEEIERCRNNYKDAGKGNNDISKFFAATALNINDDGEKDLVVQATQPFCFMGAHNTSFWVFTVIEQRLYPGYDMVFAQRADFLSVLKTSTNGYRDISTAWHTALELYETVWKFDGQKYQPRSCSIHDFKTKKTVMVRCESQ